MIYCMCISHFISNPAKVAATALLTTEESGGTDGF